MRVLIFAHPFTVYDWDNRAKSSQSFMARKHNITFNVNQYRYRHTRGRGRTTWLCRTSGAEPTTRSGNIYMYLWKMEILFKIPGYSNFPGKNEGDICFEYLGFWVRVGVRVSVRVRCRYQGKS